MTPKSKAHIRGLLGNLITFAMWRGDIPTGVNPMRLVRLRGTNRPAHPRRTITAEEFQTFSRWLSEPFRTIAFLCACLGLRISECLGLQWQDVDWLNGRLSVKRGIVRQVVDDTKTPESQKNIPISAELVEMLAGWKQTTQFGEPVDWVFASPVQLGALPWSYPNVWRVFKQAAALAGTGHISPHVLRHTYRAWLADLGTPLELQRKLMRHTSITMTLQYGDREAISAMKETNSKIAGLALNGSRTGSQEQ
jgi:integrase